MNILITGAAGFVASSLIDFFNKNNPSIKITGIDDFSFGYKRRLDNLNLKFINQNIETYTIKNRPEKFDAVIHCAATAPLPDNEINPSKSYENNVVNSIRIAEFCTKIGCNRLIFFSTGAIYENDEVFPSKESFHHQTTLVYPTSKMCAEHALRGYALSYKLKVFSLRLFNLYGPRQDYFRKQPPLIGYITKCLLNDEEATLYSDGEQRRDYIYIKDVYEIVKSLLNFDTPNNFTSLNLGTGITYSVNEIVNQLCKIANKDIKIKRKSAGDFWDKYPNLFSKTLPLDKNLIIKEVNKYSEANIDKLKALLNYTPKITLEEGLRECYEYALKYFENN